MRSVFNFFSFAVVPVCHWQIFTWCETHKDKDRRLSEGDLSIGEMKAGAGGTFSHWSAFVLMAGDYQEVKEPSGMAVRN